MLSYEPLKTILGTSPYLIRHDHHRGHRESLIVNCTKLVYSNGVLFEHNNTPEREIYKCHIITSRVTLSWKFIMKRNNSGYKVE